MSLIDRFTSFSFKYQVTFLVVLSVSIVAVCISVYSEIKFFEGDFSSFYAKNLRGYFFSGFISVGSFLLSLHSFVIVSLKDKLFSSPRYRERYARYKKISEQDINEKEILKPLDRLSGFINISIWLAITTAIAQFTIGLSPNSALSIFCVWLGLLTICFMLHSLILIRLNIKDMLHQR